jgi:hypothetical protein
VETVLATLLTTLSVNALLDGRTSPDSVVETFLADEAPVPFVVEDALGGGPAGLLLWVGQARRSGIAALRFVPVHPSLPYTVPAVDPAHARVIAAARAVAVAHGPGDFGGYGPARAVLVLGADAEVRVLDCARVPFAGLGVVTAAEACRRLRETVMAGLRIVESTPGIPEAIANAAWRDWQADMSSSIRDGIAALLPAPRYAGAVHAALDIHESMSPILAPLSIAPAQVGALLSQLHRAAADVLTTVPQATGR